MTVVREIDIQFPGMALMMVRQLCRDAVPGRPVSTIELANRLNFLHAMTQHTDMVRARSRVLLVVCRVGVKSSLCYW